MKKKNAKQAKVQKVALKRALYEKARKQKIKAEKVRKLSRLEP